MFQFGRKKEKTPAEREEKEKRKKDKREKKEKAIRDGGRLSIEDLQRLEEVRKTLGSKGGGVPAESGDKLSGITADFRDSLKSPGSSDGSVGSTSAHSGHVKLPSFSKKGILKGSKGNYDVSRSVSSDLDDMNVVLRNTKDNEYANVYRRSLLNSPTKAEAPPLPPKSTSLKLKSNPTSLEDGDFADREVSYVEAPVTTKIRRHSNHVSPVSPDKQGNFVRSENRPVSYSEADGVPFNEDVLKGESVGRNHGRPLSYHYPLHMPGLKEDESDGIPAAFHEFTFARDSDSKDFGFDLRKFSVQGNSVLLIEPKAKSEVKIMPGDQLVSVNDVNVQSMDREQVMKILRASAENVLNVKVLESLTTHYLHIKIISPFLGCQELRMLRDSSKAERLNWNKWNV